MFFFIHTDLNNMNSSYCSFISREVFMQKLEKQFHIHSVESDVVSAVMSFYRGRRGLNVRL